MDAFKRHYDIDLQIIPHQNTALPSNLDGLIIPGGFSYGDYLRGGALASHVPLMNSVSDFAKSGRSILGICNGFQILTELRLLPGVLLKNESGRFVCEQSELVLADGKSQYHQQLAGVERLCVPVAHGEGRYFIDPEGLKRLEDQGQVLFRYKTGTNPNGAVSDIAGIIDESGKILGMMPHPERATDQVMGGSEDGLKILSAFLTTVKS